jgi:glycosidase/fibronectin type 3 domain-containing protein
MRTEASRNRQRPLKRRGWSILLSVVLIVQLGIGAWAGAGRAAAEDSTVQVQTEQPPAAAPADDAEATAGTEASVSAEETALAQEAATAVNEDGTITFRLPLGQVRVTANGDFNDWGHQPGPSQTIDANDSTQTFLKLEGLEPGKEYAYKLLINGEWTHGDNLKAVADGNGTLHLPLPAVTFWVKGSFDGWTQEQALSEQDGVLSFTTGVLEDGSYEYKFIADVAGDQVYFNDPTNPLKASNGNSKLVVGATAPALEPDTFDEQPGGKTNWVLAGSFQKGLGESADWKPDGTVTRMKHLVGEYYAYSAVLDAGPYEFKITRNGDWDSGISNGGNNISFTLPSQAKVNFYVNGETKEARILVPDDATVTGIERFAPKRTEENWPRLVGSLQEQFGEGAWSPGEAKQFFVDYYFNDTVYKLQRTLTEGTHEAKAVMGSSWDAENFGDGNDNLKFKLSDTADVTFSFDNSASPKRLTADYKIGTGKYDGKVDASRIAFDSRSITFKKPFGAIKQGAEDLTLRIAVKHDDVQVARVELTDGEGIASTYPMRKTTTVGDQDYYEAVISKDVFTTIGIWGYKFILIDGSEKMEYGDDGNSGGTGTAVADGAIPFNLTVYAADYHTPDWMKNAVVYQIFPDRFFDGDKSNNRAKLADGSRGVRTETGENAGQIEKTPVQYFDGGVPNDPAPDQVWGKWGDVPERPDRSSPENAPYYPDAKTDGVWTNEFYGGDIQGIEQKLDYLKQLGVTAVYLNPVAWAASNHKYDATDYKHLDPMFGEPVYNKPGDPSSGLNYEETRKKSDAVFEKFAKAAAQKGIRIINDGVFNHVGDDSIYFDRYEKYPEIGAYEYWAKVWRTKANTPGMTKEQAEQKVIAEFTSKINPATGKHYKYPDDFGFTTWFTIGEQTVLDKDTSNTHYAYDAWWGYDSLPAMDAKEPQEGDADALDGQHEWNNTDYRNNVIGYDLTGKSDEEAAKAMQDTASQRWLWMGSSGWRLDVAPDVSSGTWRKFREAVKSAEGRADANGKPIDEPIILGEEWGVATKYLLGDQFDSVMNYRFRGAIQDFIINGGKETVNANNAANLNDALERIREDYPKEAWQAMLNLVDSHDTVRSLTKLDNPTWEEENVKIAPEASDKALKQQALIALFQMGYPGAPTIYYGDEVGVTGTKDPDSRRTFPWERIGGSNGAYEAAGRYAELYNTYKKAAEVRNANEVFRTGDLKLAYAQDNTIAYARKNETKGALVVVNSGNTASEIEADVAGYLPDGTKLTDRLGGSVSAAVEGGKIKLTVPALSGYMMVSEGNLTAVRTPANLKAEAGNGSVTLTWDAVEGADGYRVYRAPIEGGAVELLGGVTGTSYTDAAVENGIKYYYAVTATRGSGESLLGDMASATPSFPITSVAKPSQAPDVTLGVGNTTGDITVDVEAAGLTDDAAYAGEEAPHLAVRLIVYKDGDAANAAEIAMAYKGDNGPAKTYKAKFEPTEPGVYRYYAQASTDNEETFVSSEEASFTAVSDPGDTTPPAAPELQPIVTESGQASLSWTASGDDAAGYEVYRKSGDGTYAKIATLRNAESYTDYTVSNGTKYTYKVAAFDASYNRAFSGERSVTPQLVMVDVTLRLHLPDYTPATDDIYIAGTLNGWTANGGKLNVPSGATDRSVVEYKFKMMAGKSIEYKYTRGSWSTEAFTSHNRVENDTEDYGNWAYSSTDTNMRLTIRNEGGNQMTVDDYVLRWSDMPMIVTMPRISYGDDIAYETTDDKFTLKAKVPYGVRFTINGEPLADGGMDAQGNVYVENIPLALGENRFELHIEPTQETIDLPWYTDDGRASQATKTLKLTINCTGEGGGDSTAPGEVTGARPIPGNGKLTVTWKDPADSDLAKVKVSVKGDGTVDPVVVDKGVQRAVIRGLTNGKKYTLLVQTVDASGNVSAGVEAASKPSKPSGPVADQPGASTPEPGTKPTPERPGKLQASAKPDAQGTASVAFTADEVTNALQQAAGSTFTFEVKPDEGTKTVNVELPVQPLLDDGTGIGTIRIDVGFAVVTVPTGWLAEAGTPPNALKLTVAEVDANSLPADVRNRLGGSPVYEIALSADGQPVADVGGGKAVVELAYTLKPGERPYQAVAVYVSEDGKLETVGNAKYDAATGKLTFKPNRLGRYAAVYAGVSFADVPATGWFAEPIAALAARGAVGGVGDGRFDPSGRVTRAEFVAMLVNAFGLLDDQAATTLGDVRSGAWYYGAVASAQKLGIVSGKADGTFGAGDPISRQDMAVLAFKTASLLQAGLENGSNPDGFKDEAAISAYAKEAVEALRQAGIMSGTGNGAFEPQAPSTRAQAAALVYRLFQRID